MRTKKKKTLSHSTKRHKWDLQVSAREFQARLDEISLFERAAIEPSTRRNLNSAVRCFTTFCNSVGMQPLPLSFKALALFCIQYCYRFGNTTRSLPGQLALLKRANREAGHTYISEADEARLQDVISGLKKFDRTAPRRKLPMTADLLARVEPFLPLSTQSGFQVATMQRVAHDGLLRGSELVQLKRGHCQWSADGDSVTIMIHLSKANKVGPPEPVTLINYGPSSAVAYLKEYWRGLNMSEQPANAPLWPKLGHARRVPLTKNDFVKAARQALQHAGLNPQLYSGHSYRSGGATDLWASQRVRPRDIQLFGRWRSDAFYLYIRDHPHERAQTIADAFASFQRLCPEQQPAAPFGAKRPFQLSHPMRGRRQPRTARSTIGGSSVHSRPLIRAT